MISRRDTLRALAAAGLSAPVLAACGDSGSAPAKPAGGLRLVSADVPRSAGDLQAVPGAVTAMGGLTTDLWATLPTSQNLALSPYSIAVALAMTANGAVDRTQQQMLDVLHVDSLASHNGGLAALTQAVEGLSGPVKLYDGTPDEIGLAAANALFGDRAVTWQRGFLTVLAKEYGAGMHVVDWRHATETARELVNGWTSEQTHGRIPQILPAGVVDDTTRLVLVDALYFKAPWLVPFDKGSTRTGTFHRVDGSTVDVPMMTSEDGPASYVGGRFFRAARIPYVGRTLAMTVALPAPGHEADALAELLGSGLHAGGGGVASLRLSMPRWTYRVATDLTDPLKALGMTLPFSDQADFSAMTTDAELVVSDVLHQTYVAVDEYGTEAAAATAVVMGETALPVSQEVLVLDRPFLFVVHDAAHGTPLFVGRVADPS